MIKWVEITRLAEAFHVLPKQGGLFDQEYMHIKKMVKVLEASQFADDLKQKQKEAKERARNRT